MRLNSFDQTKQPIQGRINVRRKDAQPPTPTTHLLSTPTIQRAIVNPSALRGSDILALQRTIGNQTVLRLLAKGDSARPTNARALSSGALQAKLTVGPATDIYEQEADKVAGQVMRQSNTTKRHGAPNARSSSQQANSPAVQKIAHLKRDDKAQSSTAASPTVGAEGGKVDANMEREIQHTSGGHKLDEPVRRKMEGAFDSDFSGVRVYANAKSDTLNRSLQSTAFTTGQNIFFKNGAYHPSSSDGQRLIAHELTHVVQQNGPGVQKKAEASPTKQDGAPQAQRTLAPGQIQRYMIQTPNPNDVKGGTQFQAQELDANTGAFTNLQGANTPPLRVSEDGKMAIEDSDLTNRQPKVFYALSSVISSSNSLLKKVKSKYILYVSDRKALTVNDAAGHPHQLDQIMPREVKKSESGIMGAFRRKFKGAQYENQGLGMTVEATCVAVGEAIMGKKMDFMLPILQKRLPKGDPFLYEYRVARYMVERHTTNEKTAKGNINTGNLATAMDTIASAYSNLLTTNPGAAAAIAQDIGINEYADPKVGQAFQTITMGDPNANPGGVSDFGADPTGNTRVKLTTPDTTRSSGIRRDAWGNHVGAVVAKSAGNMVTLENYARSHEEGKLGGSDPRYYFQMYGPKTKPAQSWHSAWVGSGTPLINPITMVYGKNVK